MDVLIDDVAELDGPLLASLWVRAVLAADPAMIASVEIECERRGTTARALVAATKKKDSGMVQTVGERRAGPHDYAAIGEQMRKNIAEGKSWDTGQATYQTKGYNPYRVPKGKKGGGRFTTKSGSAAETTDPSKPRPGAKRIEEDQVPDKSPGGADLQNYDGSGSGMALYEDGSVYDGNGWRNAKGEALDANGNVIRKPKKGKAGKGKGKGGGGTGGTSAKAQDAAKARAQKQADTAASQAWDSAENRRKAEEQAASQGNYGPLLTIAERTEREARKRRDLAKTETERVKAAREVTAAQKDLATIRQAATKAAEAKQTAAQAKQTARQAEHAATQAAQQKARYAAIAANYPAWEKALRAEYADVGLSETELHDLIIRDRARRIRLLPRNYGAPGGPSGPSGP